MHSWMAKFAARNLECRTNLNDTLGSFKNCSFYRIPVRVLQWAGGWWLILAILANATDVSGKSERYLQREFIRFSCSQNLRFILVEILKCSWPLQLLLLQHSLCWMLLLCWHFKTQSRGIAGEVLLHVCVCAREGEYPRDLENRAPVLKQGASVI